MPDGDLQSRTLGEVGRRLDEVFSRFEQVANDLPKTFVSRELLDTKLEVIRLEHEKAEVGHKELLRRVNDLEDDKKWLYRLVIGAVIMALLGLAFGLQRTAGKSSGMEQVRVTWHYDL